MTTLCLALGALYLYLLLGLCIAAVATSVDGDQDADLWFVAWPLVLPAAALASMISLAIAAARGVQQWWTR